MKWTVIYGANSFIGKNLFETLKESENVITVGNRNCDFTYEEFNQVLREDTLQIKGLVYTTGRGQPPESNLEDNPELFEKNTFGFFKLMELLEPNLWKYASIVYISSGHATRASDLNPYYAASKASVNSYVVSISKKFSKMNIKDKGTRRINAIAPEAIESPMIEEMVSQGDIPMEVYVLSRPSMRLLTVQEVVEPTKFMLSNGSSGINGQILVIGGVK